MDTELKKHSTVLPYVLGGKDDPHFSGDGNPPCNIPSQSNETEKPFPTLKPLTMTLSPAPVLTELEKSLEDIGGNFLPDRIEANEDIYGNDYWSLRDEGRSFGEGESYAERNV